MSNHSSPMPDALPSMVRSDESPVVLKVIELCQVLCDQPAFAELRNRVEAFQADPELQERYHELSECGTRLQEQHRRGSRLSDAEIAAFEKMREEFLANPVAVGFLDAQQEMMQVRDTLNRYVARTLELGRVASREDFESCGCGSSCGCG